jgi:catechol 2,3-dioxygenase-like lactoylglutathione lyase family enzyme
MLIDTLFHVAIKTRDLKRTEKFYVNVLGMKVAERPAIGFPGIWLSHALPGGAAILHIYAGDAAKEADGSFACGSGVVDHISLISHGFREFQEQFRRCGLRWRENVVPDAGLWQLFVYDPSGVLLELTFSAAAEGHEAPQIPSELLYKPRENFFCGEDYDQFSSP